MSVWDLAINLTAAGLLGSAIGLEREWRHRMAGLKTNALVALGAAIFMTTTGLVADQAGPARVVGQIVTGVGFLGGGVIMKDGQHIRGLNTAATIWGSAAVGTFAGMGALMAATLAAALVVVLNVVLRPVANWVSVMPVRPETPTAFRYRVVAICAAPDQATVRQALAGAAAAHKLDLYRLETSLIAPNDEAEIIALCSSLQRQDDAVEALVSAATAVGSVRSVRWKRLDRSVSAPPE